MPSHKDIAAILSDGKAVEAVLRKAVREALVRHKQAGKPVVEWRDGRIVWIAPEDLDEVIRKMDAGEE